MTTPKPHTKHRTQSAKDNCLTCSPARITVTPGQIHPKWAPGNRKFMPVLHTTVADLHPGDECYVGRSVPPVLFVVTEVTPTIGYEAAPQLNRMWVRGFWPTLETRGSQENWFLWMADEVVTVVGVQNRPGHRLD